MGTGGAVVKGSKLIGQGGKWAYKGGKKYIWDGTKKLWRKMIGEGAANGVNKTRVGQWMSKAEYEQFVKTGEIPRSNVLTKGKEGYMKQANSGDHYVEFDIDSSLLFTKDPNLGWSLVKSKNPSHIKLAESKGQSLPSPVGENITHVDTKP